MPLPIDFIERLKAANPIAEVMSSYVTLKRTGRDYVCLCPFHNEKTPSCHIHPDKEYFHCFGCGAGGDVITFTMKYNNLDYWEAVKLLAERGGVPLPEDNGYDSKRTDTRKRFYEMNKTAARFFYHQLKTPQGKECLDYLINKRKLSIETIKKYGMGFAPNSWSALKSYMLSEGFTEEELEQGSLISRSQKNTRNTFDFFVNRAMFPFIDLAGHIVGFGGRALTPDDKRKYLNSKDTLVYSKNRFLFSMNFAKNAAVKDKTILLCEGNLDVISLNQAGFENAVASCGTALTPEQARIISNYADNVVICYDADGAGQKATTRAIKILGETGLKTTVIKMNGAKDPDEYINKFGADHFRHLLKKSDGAIEFELEKCKDGIDTDTDIGRIDYLKKAYKVLADIKVRRLNTAESCIFPSQFKLGGDIIGGSGTLLKRPLYFSFDTKYAEETVYSADKVSGFDGQLYDDPIRLYFGDENDLSFSAIYDVTPSAYNNAEFNKFYVSSKKYAEVDY